MIVLTEPVQVKNLTRIKCQHVRFEANEERGQEWVEVYCEFGFLDDGTFYAYPLPGTLESVRYFKFENGMHPERPGTALGRCSVCNRWHFAKAGPCEEQGCSGIVEPFPSYNRFRNKVNASAERDVFKATEAFLVDKDGTEGQRFPDPYDIGNVRPLIDGEA